jgi:spermidine synthase
MAARAGNADVLHVGGGGLTFPRYLAVSSPLSRHTVLELDPVVLATAREELGFSQGDRIRVVLGDARLSIGALADGAFDLVVGDAFGGLSVPWHLTTREFVAEIERVLRPGGRYVMNLIDGEAFRFARAQAATLQVVFPNVALLAGGSSLAGRSGGNVVLVASAGPLDTDTLRLSLRTAGDVDTQVVDGPALDAFIVGASVLSDDFAPVDQLTGR